MGGATGASFLNGRLAGSILSFTPREASVAVVDAVGMWAMRERRPSAPSCPWALPASTPLTPSRHTAIWVRPASA